jgi:predicted secreted protein
MRRNGVSNVIATGLLVVGIIIGVTGFYAAAYPTKTATQTETTTAMLTTKATTTAMLTTTATVTLPGVAEFAYEGTSQNSSISVAANETFVIQLSSNAYDSGYVWNVSRSTSIQYFDYVSVPSSLGCCGRPTLYYYFFRAVQTGTQTITLQAKQPSAPYAIYATINLKVAVSSS